jgi:hypothetical protein
MLSKRIFFCLIFLFFCGLSSFVGLKCSPSSTIDVPVLKDTSAHLPTTITVKFGKSEELMEFEFVRISPGSFKMGRNKDIFDYIPLLDVIDGYSHPSFRATITKGYYIGKDNINTAQFAVFLNILNEKERDKYVNLEKDNHYLQYENGEKIKIINDEKEPVKTVSWCGAVAFCEWLSTYSTMTFRLPTEAEWELAARGHNNTYDYVWANNGHYYPPGPIPPNGVQGLATGYLGNWVSDYAACFTPEHKIDPECPSNAEEENFHILRRPMHSIVGRSSGYFARKNNGIYGFRVVLNEDSVRKFIEHPELLPENISIQYH